MRKRFSSWTRPPSPPPPCSAFLRGVAAAEPQRTGEKPSFAAYRTDLAEGRRFLTRSRLLLGITLMVMVTNGLDQGWSSVLLPVHGREDLGDATALGLMVSLFGGFALLGALLYGAWGQRFPRRAVFAGAFLISGATRYVVAAVTDTPLPLAVTMALSGLAAGVLNPILTTVVYELVPEDMRSRVSSVSMAGSELAMPMGGLAAGLLVDAFGVTPALLAFAAVYLLATLIPLVFPSWRGLDGKPSVSRTERPRSGSAPAASPPRPSAK
ncbi:hypothetical protein GCM10017750_40560 [Streptomyces racemochromogenes]